MFAHRISPDLELRLLEPVHADELCELTQRSCEHLSFWCPGGAPGCTLEQVSENIKNGLRSLADDKRLRSGIWYQGALAGVIDIWATVPHSRKTRLGYWLGSEYQGKGLMTAAARAAVDHVFSRMKFNRIEIGTMAENARSRAVAERLGFMQEGISKQCYSPEDDRSDRVWYALLREEWNGGTDGISFSYPIDSDSELRLLLPCDADSYHGLIADNQDHLRPWFRWAEGPMSITETRAFISRSLLALADESGIHWSIWHKGEMAGYVGTSRMSRSSKCATIAYLLDRRFEGKGLAHLAVHSLLTHLFDILDMNRVELRLDTRNTRSRKLAQRLGFSHEGTSRQSEVSEGNLVDMEVYSLLKAAWRG